MITAPAPALDFCLFLDVDGTLIELAATPFDTRVGEELKRLLNAVSDRLGGAVALVSGRSIAYLDAMFAPLALPSAGLHGVERRSASGTIHGASFHDSQLASTRTALAALAQTHPGVLLEDKGRTLAIHYRLAPQFASVIHDAITGLVAALGPQYHVQPGSMMFEIKPRGFNKGNSVKEFMQEAPFSGRQPVYIGDDITDLDGFRAADDLGGLSIAVGDRVQARYHLSGPAAVHAWLQGIANLVDSHHE
jgi:trehalose 6-phosphate phosphatase